MEFSIYWDSGGITHRFGTWTNELVANYPIVKYLLKPFPSCFQVHVIVFPVVWTHNVHPRIRHCVLVYLATQEKPVPDVRISMSVQFLTHVQPLRAVLMRRGVSNVFVLKVCSLDLTLLNSLFSMDHKKVLYYLLVSCEYWQIDFSKRKKKVSKVFMFF